MQKYNSVIIGLAVFLILTIIYFKIVEHDKAVEERIRIRELKEKQTQDSINIAEKAEFERRKPFQKIQEKVNYLLNQSWEFGDDGFIEKNSDSEAYRINVRDMNFSYYAGSLQIMCADSSNCFNYTESPYDKYDKKTYSKSVLHYTCSQSTFDEVNKQIKKYRRIMRNP